MAQTRPVALVTGASSGIGATFARALKPRGYDLILVARRRIRLEEVAREVGGEILVADLTEDSDVRRVEERIRAENRLELLVNNAGFGISGAFASADIDAQYRMHRLHINATLRLTGAALPGMGARGKGAVISVSSVAGFLTIPGSVSYCATKGWINSFTEGLRLELKAAGSPVKVQALCPGFTYSEFHDVAAMNRAKLAPRSWWMPAEMVVQASLEGLDRDRLFVIPGWRYRLAVGAIHWMPRALKRALLTRMARKSGRLR